MYICSDSNFRLKDRIVQTMAEQSGCRAGSLLSFGVAEQMPARAGATPEQGWDLIT
jgi:hypothetical protein